MLCARAAGVPSAMDSAMEFATGEAAGQPWPVSAQAETWSHPSAKRLARGAKPGDGWRLLEQRRALSVLAVSWQSKHRLMIS